HAASFELARYIAFAAYPRFTTVQRWGPACAGTTTRAVPRGSGSVTAGARVAAAIEIMAAIEEGGRPADDIAADYFRRRRYIGAKDRVQVSAHVYAVLRHRAVIDWWIARVSHGQTPP